MFFQVFRKVEKQLPQLTTLDLQYVSPQLLKARNLDLAMPGMHIGCTAVVPCSLFVDIF